MRPIKYDETTRTPANTVRPKPMKRLRNLLSALLPGLLLAALSARAETVVWSDNFDTNAATRWTANGVWKITSPTTGPAKNAAGYHTYSGAKCATTQNYAVDEDSTLVCNNYNGATSLVVPPATQFPRLRFWHWFSMANALGFVEISTNNGAAWTQISPTYTYASTATGGGIWSRPSIDLSAYAGQSIQIAFRFYGGPSGNGLGWFVDDVAVVTGVPLLNFPEGFEQGQGDWSVETGTWQIGEPTSGPKAAHSGTNCAATILAGNYPNNVDTRLISPFFTVPGTGAATLRFAQWFSLSDAVAFVEINNGYTTVTTTTNTVITNTVTAVLNTNIYQFFGAANTNYAAPFYWNPTIGGWTNATKVLGSVLEPGVEAYYFEAGNPPLSKVGELYLNLDYRDQDVLPIPQSLTPTNSFQLQGSTWISENSGVDTPIGYFGTNYTYTYTTNTTVVTSAVTWNQISPTWQNGTSGGAWQNISLDLSSYAGQTVQLAFHFGSGGLATAPGWYIDDIYLLAPPLLLMPADTNMTVGEELTAQIFATNMYLSAATYTFKLLSPPEGATITTSGLLTYAPNFEQPSSTNTITVEVSDNSTPPLTATNSFVVTLLNPNLPALTVPPTQTIYAGQTMTVTNYATNSFSPDDTFTFSLVSPPLTNMDDSNLAANGVLIWPTLVTQRPGTYTNAISVTDNFPPYAGVTNSFLVVVSAPPLPVLTLPANLTNYAGWTFNVPISATNPAFPDSVFNYSLTNSPTNAVIKFDTGELTWPTTPTNKSKTVSFTVVVSDSTTLLSTNGTFQVTVSPTPRPTLIVPATQTNYAGQQLAMPLGASNSILPNATYTFSLLAASTNLLLASATTTNAVLTWTNTGIVNGVLHWTNNSVAPATNTISVRVQDNSAWTNAVTNHFELVFLPPRPPQLISSNEVIYVGDTFTNVVLSATNCVLTAATYTFALAKTSTNGSVAGGLLAWTNKDLPPGIYPLYVRITDDSVPPILITNNFAVTVLPFPDQLGLASPAALNAGGINQGFRFDVTTPWTNMAWRVEAATNLDASAADWLPVYTNPTGAGGGLLFTDLLATNFPQRYYRAVFP
jgi:hypothetical protein